MAKTPEKTEGAFRTIREVADWLGVPTHVLRFWESKFEQIAPVKGAGGRRYYRPEDMRLLGGIKVMLHDQGLPIRGVGQKIDDDGVESVMALSPDVDKPNTTAAPKKRRVIRSGEEEESPRVVPFERGRSETGPTAPPEPDLPSDLPNPVEIESAQPDAPADDEGDAVVPQPSDRPPPEPIANPAQPDAPPREAGPAPDPAVTDTPPVARPREPLDRISKRRALRRVVRKLRGLIEEVEGDLGDAGKS
ncbi:MerR family transcriptional regulator [Jannaschia sp. S6380]|uniref:MerR family transcriptional regulator n=1 Tax=Jannaschia sp. S6380 TaxID=2926408 RepID=UPI001FF1165D|nr:MerR family transcriptional regulator [Jannaschia sp. S6380]MCK0166112.1 MerR family transcriptional regulator [Jannaschia sp. S6380]